MQMAKCKLHTSERPERGHDASHRIDRRSVFQFSIGILQFAFCNACFFTLPGLLAVGCQREAPAPQSDPKALQREAEKLKKEHDRETHNR
jgi:hypothetical protein